MQYGMSIFHSEMYVCSISISTDFKCSRLKKPVDVSANAVARQLISLATDLDSVQISQFSVPKFFEV